MRSDEKQHVPWQSDNFAVYTICRCLVHLDYLPQHAVDDERHEVVAFECLFTALGCAVCECTGKYIPRGSKPTRYYLIHINVSLYSAQRAWPPVCGIRIVEEDTNHYCGALVRTATGTNCHWYCHWYR